MTHRPPRQLKTTLVAARVLVPLLLLSVCLGQAPAQLVDYNWLGGTGLWSEPTGWQEGQVPDSELARVFIDAGQSQVTLEPSAATAYSVHVGSDDQLILRDQLRLQHQLTNQGTVCFEQIGQVFLEGNTTLNGGGVLELAPPTFRPVFDSEGFPPVVLTNIDNSIEGHGSFFVPIQNFGNVTANVAGETLAIGGTNFGTMSATGGGRLSWSGTSTNEIVAHAGSTVAIGGSELNPTSGGVFTAVSGPDAGTIEIGGAVEDIQTNGLVHVLNGSRIDGNIVNTGTWQIQQQFNINIVFPLLSGGGSIQLNEAWLALSGAEGGQLVNLDNKIRGRGVIDHPAIFNGGRIEADVAGEMLVLRLGDLTNRGVLSAAAGSTLLVEDPGVGNLEVLNTNGQIHIEADATFEARAIMRGGQVHGLNAPGAPLPSFVARDGSIDSVTILGKVQADINVQNSLNLVGQLVVSPAGMSYSGNVELEGGGQLDLNGSRFELTDPTPSTNGLFNRDVTIRGHGQLITRLFENFGHVVADTAGSSLSVTTTGSGDFRNVGLLEATAGGLLEVGDVDNAGGQIRASNNSIVRAQGVIGGTLATTSTGRIESARVVAATIDGTVTPNALENSMKLSGTIVNNGLVTNSGIFPIRYAVDNSASQALIWLGSGTWEIHGTNNASVAFVNGADHVIQGFGEIDTDTALNLGRIITDDTFTLRAGEIVNYGVIEGAVSFEGSAVSFIDGVSLHNHGQFAPGLNTIQVRTLTGDALFRNEIDGSLVVELDDMAYSLLEVEGAVDLAGTLVLELLTGSLFYGTEHVIITAASTELAGTFDKIEGVIVSDTVALATTYESTMSMDTVTVTVALPGDANLDGTVDGDDFAVWNTFKFQGGMTWSNGDFNGDGFVDGFDLLLWNQNKFSSTTAVPEPVSSVILLLLAVATRRRKPAA